MSHGEGGGAEKCQKSVTYYLNGPKTEKQRMIIFHFTNYFYLLMRASLFVLKENQRMIIFYFSYFFIFPMRASLFVSLKQMNPTNK